MSNNDRIVDDVRMASDIVEIISQYVPLKKSGSNFKGLCPFHQEKSPSFMVHPAKQIFHCFGCAAGGDVFSFLMKHDNMNFPEALESLAERAHIRLPERTGRREGGASGENDQFYVIHTLAQDYYHSKLLNAASGKVARDYIYKRGLGQAIIEEFKLGWAGEEWQGLFDFLSRKGFSEKLLLAAGVVKQSSGGRIYDLFRGRIIFPILNLQGKVIGFGGRTMTSEGGPKYLNSPESPVFQKRRELFGLYYAKKFIDSAVPRLLVVEGYMDFLALYAAGFKNAVATLGTALTSQHVQVMKRFAEEAVVIYDGDKAGQAASLKGLEVFLEGGMSVKLVRMPEGYDPDDWIKQKGSASFQELIDKAMDFFDFKMDIALARHNVRDSLGVVKITQDFLDTLAKVTNPILAGHYIARLSAIVKIDERSLRTELAKRRGQSGSVENSGASPHRAPAAAPAPRPAGATRDELTLIVMMMDDIGIRRKVVKEFKESDFTNPVLGQLFRHLVVGEQNEALPDWPALLRQVPDTVLREELLRLAAMDMQPEEREKAYVDCMATIRKKKKDQKLESLREQIDTAERRRDSAEVARLVAEYQGLIAASKKSV
ncbi:MAG: DNA primase [Candidatus Omnitrophica bacterium]|nr:DNA primase [Candidatus Omnitrophota bacterium]